MRTPTGKSTPPSLRGTRTIDDVQTSVEAPIAADMAYELGNGEQEILR